MQIVNTKKTTKQGVLYYRTCAYCGNVVTYYHTNKPTHCPYCGASKFVKPKTETTLFLLQKKYFDSGRDPAVLAELYKKMKPYTISLIKKGPLKNFYYEYDDLDIKASEATSLVIEYYLAKPAFKIESSFGGYLNYKIKEVFYNKVDQKEDQMLSLNGLIPNQEGKTKEVQDLSMQMNLQPIFYDENKHLRYERNKKEVLEGVYKIIDLIYNTARQELSVKDATFVILGILIRVQKDGLRNIDAYYHLFGSKYKKHVDKALLFLYEFIKESEQHHEEWDHE